MKTLLQSLCCITFILFLGACEGPEKPLNTTTFEENGYKGYIKYYEDHFYVDFDTEKNGYYSEYTIDFTDTKTNENVYFLKGKCYKYYYCNEDIKYSHFKEGEYKGVATLETGAKAEFTVTIPATVTQDN